MLFGIHPLGWVFINSFVAFIYLFIISKILGKKQIAQLEFIDYTVGISLGSIARRNVLRFRYTVLLLSDRNDYLFPFGAARGDRRTQDHFLQAYIKGQAFHAHLRGKDRL